MKCTLENKPKQKPEGTRQGLVSKVRPTIFAPNFGVVSI